MPILVMATVVCVNSQASLSNVQVITLDHEKYERELNNIAQGHSKSVQARDNMKLRVMGTADAAKCDLSARLPKVYEALGEETGALKTTWVLCIPTLTYTLVPYLPGPYCTYLLGLIPVDWLTSCLCTHSCDWPVHTLPGCYADGQEERPRAEPLTDVELREHFPAASSSQDTYTLLKFYNLSKDLVRTVLQVCLCPVPCLSGPCCTKHLTSTLHSALFYAELHSPFCFYIATTKTAVTSC